jgi:fibronectin-binding autotransporter adhesin
MKMALRLSFWTTLLMMTQGAFGQPPPTTNTWTGADPSGYWSAPANWSPTGVPVNGNDLGFPGGLPPGDMVSTNDLADSSFRSIRFGAASRHTIRGNPITLTNRSDCVVNGGTNVIACDLTFSGTPATPNYQFYSIRGFGAPTELTLIGNVGGGSLYVFSERLVIRGQFTGGSLFAQYGTLALYGDNPYAVSASIRGSSFSTLRVQGSQPNLNITMLWEMESATCPSLSGDGVVGDVTGCGHITPDSTLSVENLDHFGGWGGLDIRLNGTNVGEYGRLVASGDVSLSSGRLLPSAGFNPQAGQIYTIVEKTSPGPITNAIFGREGTVTYLNGVPFRISYVGGDGNDVTLTVVTPVPIVLSAMQWSFGTQFVFSYSADVGLRYAVERSATLSNWTTIRSNTAEVNPMTVTDTAATNRMNFYRVRRLPNP